MGPTHLAKISIGAVRSSTGFRASTAHDSGGILDEQVGTADLCLAEFPTDRRERIAHLMPAAETNAVPGVLDNSGGLCLRSPVFPVRSGPRACLRS